MNMLIYTLTTIFHGAKFIFIGLVILVGVFAFFTALIVPPMAAFHSFVDNNLWYGSMWLIITLFVYGIGFKSSNHSGNKS